jgi:subtilisin family serine protease
MKNAVVAVGALASVLVLSGNAWAQCCSGPNPGSRPGPSPGYQIGQHQRYPGQSNGYRGGGGGGGGFVGGLIGGMIGAIGAGIVASEERPTNKAEPETKPVRRAAKTEPPRPKVARAPAQVTPPKPPINPVPRQPDAPKPPLAAPGDENKFVPDEVIFEVRNTVPQSTVDDIARQNRLTRISSQRLELIGSTVYRCRIAEGRQVPDVVRVLEQDLRIASAQPNFLYRLADDPASNSLSSTQYAVAKMHLPEAHRLSTGQGVVVAIIDSGIDSAHPELAGSIADAFDVVDGVARPHKHGTAVAGIIGSHANLMGVAPGAKLLAIRAFAGEEGKLGAGDTTDHIVRSIDWAHQRGARVINMSFTGPRDPLLSRELRAGTDKGIVFIAAAGNDGPNAAAADDSVIAVTASDVADKLYPAANRGPHICLAAPGVNVLVAAPSGAYEFKSGTSLSAAHVSGAVALLLQSRPDLSPKAVRTILLNRARHLNAEAGSDSDCGIGLTDALAMVTEPGEKHAPKEVSSSAREEISTVGSAARSGSRLDRTTINQPVVGDDR